MTDFGKEIADLRREKLEAERLREKTREDLLACENNVERLRHRNRIMARQAVKLRGALKRLHPHTAGACEGCDVLAVVDAMDHT